MSQTQYLHYQNTLNTNVWHLNLKFPSHVPLFPPGSLPLRRRMDDEEEDMSQPILQLWGASFREVKYEDRATPFAAGQALAAVTAAVPPSQSHNNNGISINTLPCSLHWQPRIPVHGKKGWEGWDILTLLKWSGPTELETEYDIEDVRVVYPPNVSHSFCLVSKMNEAPSLIW